MLCTISDRLPNFLKIENFQPSSRTKTVRRRLVKQINLKNFIVEEHLQNIDVTNINSRVNNDSKQ